METNREIMEILRTILRKIESQNPIKNEWLTKEELKKLFSYSDTSIVRIEKHIKSSKIGARKFYSTKSILEFMEKKSVTNEKNNENKS
jgi:hypothetical protein